MRFQSTTALTLGAAAASLPLAALGYQCVPSLCAELAPGSGGCESWCVEKGFDLGDGGSRPGDQPADRDGSEELSRRGAERKRASGGGVTTCTPDSCGTAADEDGGPCNAWCREYQRPGITFSSGGESMMKKKKKRSPAPAPATCTPDDCSSTEKWKGGECETWCVMWLIPDLARKEKRGDSEVTCTPESCGTGEEGSGTCTDWCLEYQNIDTGITGSEGMKKKMKKKRSPAAAAAACTAESCSTADADRGGKCETWCLLHQRPDVTFGSGSSSESKKRADDDDNGDIEGCNAGLCPYLSPGAGECQTWCQDRGLPVGVPEPPRAPAGIPANNKAKKRSDDDDDDDDDDSDDSFCYASMCMHLDSPACLSWCEDQGLPTGLQGNFVSSSSSSSGGAGDGTSIKKRHQKRNCSISNCGGLSSGGTCKEWCKGRTKRSLIERALDSVTALAGRDSDNDSSTATTTTSSSSSYATPTSGLDKRNALESRDGDNDSSTAADSSSYATPTSGFDKRSALEKRCSRKNCGNIGSGTSCKEWCDNNKKRNAASKRSLIERALDSVTALASRDGDNDSSTATTTTTTTTSSSSDSYATPTSDVDKRSALEKRCSRKNCGNIGSGTSCKEWCDNDATVSAASRRSLLERALGSMLVGPRVVQPEEDGQAAAAAAGQEQETKPHVVNKRDDGGCSEFKCGMTMNSQSACKQYCQEHHLDRRSLLERAFTEHARAWYPTN